MMGLWVGEMGYMWKKRSLLKIKINGFGNLFSHMVFTLCEDRGEEICGFGGTFIQQ